MKPRKPIGEIQPARKRISWCKNCQGPIWSGEPFDIVATTVQGVYSIKARHKDGKCNAPKQA